MTTINISQVFTLTFFNESSDFHDNDEYSEYPIEYKLYSFIYLRVASYDANMFTMPMFIPHFLPQTFFDTKYYEIVMNLRLPFTNCIRICIACRMYELHGLCQIVNIKFESGTNKLENRKRREENQ